MVKTIHSAVDLIIIDYITVKTFYSRVVHAQWDNLIHQGGDTEWIPMNYKWWGLERYNRSRNVSICQLFYYVTFLFKTSTL